MSHRPPTPQVIPTPDPLINLGETNAEVKNQKNKQGFLSTFLTGSRNRTAGLLGTTLSGQRSVSLGNTNL
jgi:hypothetical protein